MLKDSFKEECGAVKEETAEPVEVSKVQKHPRLLQLSGGGGGGGSTTAKSTLCIKVGELIVVKSVERRHFFRHLFPYLAY